MPTSRTVVPNSHALLLPQRVSQYKPVQSGTLSQVELRDVCMQRRLPYTANTWRQLDGLEDQQVIFAEGTERRLSLEALGQKLVDIYKRNNRMSGIGKAGHYTLNTLVTAHEFANGKLHNAAPAVVRSKELDNMPIVTRDQLTATIEDKQIEYSSGLLESAMGTAAYRVLEARYPLHLPILPKGRYRGDGMIFMKDDLYRGGTVVELTSRELAVCLEHYSLTETRLQPVAHFLLQRHAVSANLYGYQKRGVKPHPPEGGPISKAYASQELSSSAIQQLLSDGRILPLTYGEGDILNDITVRNIYERHERDLATPVDALYCRDTQDSSQQYISTRRLTRTMSALAAYDGDGSAVLCLSHLEAAMLWAANIASGEHELLARAAVDMPGPLDKQVTMLNIAHIESFAAAMGYAFDTNVFERATHWVADLLQQIYADAPGITAMPLQLMQSRMGQLFKFAVNSHEIHVFGQYLKALHQQGVFADASSKYSLIDNTI